MNKRQQVDRVKTLEEKFKAIVKYLQLEFALELDMDNIVIAEVYHFYDFTKTHNAEVGKMPKDMFERLAKKAEGLNA